jgi:hypothetical protein
VFLTHLFNRQIEERLLKLIGEAAGAGADVFVLAEARTPVPGAYGAITERFEFARLRARARSVIGNSLLPGNCHLRALDFFDRHPGYAHYWFVEYDAVYSGDWGRLFAALEDDPSDLLAARFAAIGDDPDWPWQRDFSTAGDAVDKARWVRAFFPVHRLSAAALQCIAQAVGRGWTGHFEVLVPTALGHAGLTMADIGGRSAWTPAARRDRHYLDCPLPDRFHCFGTLRYRPAIRSMPVADLIYHPVKTAGETVEPWPNRRRLRTLARYPGRVLAHGLRLGWRAALAWSGWREAGGSPAPRPGGRSS